LYATLGVPDTLDGRFDAIVLHVYLIVRRLDSEPDRGQVLAQAVFDAMFLDMDINLREMGVGDLSVGKRNRAMWEAFHGRSAAYAAVWDDTAAFEAAIARNFWRGAPSPAGSAPALVRLAGAQAACLAGQGLDALLRGDVLFVPAAEAAR
jgi:cytochrome b pre-mRNA-processing protein 3